MSSPPLPASHLLSRLPTVHLISLSILSTLAPSSHAYVPTFFFHPFLHLPLNTSPSLHLPTFLVFFQLCVWLSMQLCDPSHQQWGLHQREPGPQCAVPRCVFVCLLVFLFARVYVSECGWSHVRTCACSCTSSLVSTIWI